MNKTVGAAGAGRSWAFLAAGVLAVVIFGYNASPMNRRNQASFAASFAQMQATPVPDTPKERRQRLDRDCYNAVQGALNDPDGAELPNYLIVDYPLVPGKRPHTLNVYMPFKARNGFNALRSAMAVCTFKVDKNADPISFTYRIKAD